MNLADIRHAAAAMNPMTDLEKLTFLLNEFGVGFTSGENHGFTSDGNQGGPYLKCEQGGAKIAGYSGFFTSFEFDHAGKFLRMAAYEE